MAEIVGRAVIAEFVNGVRRKRHDRHDALGDGGITRDTLLVGRDGTAPPRFNHVSGIGRVGLHPRGFVEIVGDLVHALFAPADEIGARHWTLGRHSSAGLTSAYRDRDK